MQDKLLTVRQAAEILNVTSWQVRQYIKNGQIEAHPMGEGKGHGIRWRIWNKDLVAFINKRTNNDLG